MRNENREIEEKLREALNTAQHRGDVIKQLREEVKAADGKTHDAEHRIEQMEKELQQIHGRYAATSREMNRLQASVQEKDIVSNQSETMFKAKISDKEEETARLKAEINILHEKLTQSSSQVSHHPLKRTIARFGG